MTNPNKPQDGGAVSPDNYLRFYSPGSIHREIRVGFGVHRCGEVADGVPIHVDPDGAGFVIAFKDLETWYLAAKRLRAGK